MEIRDGSSNVDQLCRTLQVGEFYRDLVVELCFIDFEGNTA